MYLIKGDEEYFINKKINEIINQTDQDELSEIEIIKFYDYFTLDELSDALGNTGLFFTKKIIVLKNPFVFNNKNKYSKNSINNFIELIKTSSEDENITYIFSQEINKYDKTFQPSSAFTFISKISNIIEVNKVSERNIFSVAYNIIKENGGTIKDADLLDFLANMPNNLSLIEAEIKKLLLIDKNITKKMIDDNNFFASNNIEFALPESILKWEKPQIIIKKINEQIEYGINESQIISQISSILYNAKSIHVLRKKNKQNEEIAKILNIHPYRVKLHIDFLYKIGTKKLDELILSMQKIDFNFRKGKINSSVFIGLVKLNLLK
ncbi:DNA polymerase III subunit delta [Metamycoplasma gateae]|uniref:DNA polymerase III subunit delta n=1 Tax=Metamycoplasma gateae TaxID=35769 RepID=A0ABZ2AID9_9BACT|nr:DNA polymerase III subunit delta [Metamycoplasma gateae]